MPADLDSTHISHDPEVVKAYDNDPLVNTKATAGWFEAILEAQQQALRMASTTAGPLHMLQAGEDYLVSNAAQDTFFNALPSDVRKTKTVYDGLYHELLQEPEREEVMGQIRRLIQEDAALEPEA